jgi:hypothetical protein
MDPVAQIAMILRHVLSRRFQRYDPAEYVSWLLKPLVVKGICLLLIG